MAAAERTLCFRQSGTSLVLCYRWVETTNSSFVLFRTTRGICSNPFFSTNSESNRNLGESGPNVSLKTRRIVSQIFFIGRSSLLVKIKFYEAKTCEFCPKTASNPSEHVASGLCDLAPRLIQRIPRAVERTTCMRLKSSSSKLESNGSPMASTIPFCRSDQLPGGSLQGLFDLSSSGRMGG